MLAGHQVDPLKIIVMGTASTGKTYLINAIRSRLQELAETGSKSPVVVLAPTGVAAFNINGTTITQKGILNVHIMCTILKYIYYTNSIFV